MAEQRMGLLELLRKAGSDGDVDFLREGVRALAQAVMEAEVTELTGVPQGERDPERRLTRRNGYRERRWDTRVGTVELAIPRVRDGSYFPSLLEPRRRAERALLAVVQEAYVLGVSTRRVEDLVEALGIASLSKSEVSRICAALDAEVDGLPPPLAGWASVTRTCWLDATYLKVREAGPGRVDGRPWSRSGSALTGERRVLGLELAARQRRGQRLGRLHPRARRARPRGVRLVISDAHRGLVKAVREQLLGAAWQRCRVHFTRNAQDLVPRGARSMVAARSGRSSSSPTSARPASSCGRVVDGLAARFPAVADLLARGRAGPARPLHVPRGPPAPDPLDQSPRAAEQGDQAPDRGGRASSPTRASVIRLVGMVLAEQDDEWQDGRRYFRPETMPLIDAVPTTRRWPALLMAS